MRVGKHPDWKGPPPQRRDLRRVPRRRRRRRLRHGRRLRAPRRALHGAGRSQGEVVTWQRRKKSTSPLSAPVPPARSSRTCWRAPARRSWCSSSGPTGTTSNSSARRSGASASSTRRASRLAGRNPAGHGSNAGWGTGGAMIHFFANWPRMHPVDFRVKSQYGKGLDWPISYDELSPWYDRAAEDIGVSGNAAAERRWYPVGKDYPMPPLKTLPAGRRSSTRRSRRTAFRWRRCRWPSTAPSTRAGRPA